MKILDDIKAKREAATPGRWPCYSDPDIARQIMIDGILRPAIAPSDAEYIARMDPRTVKAMENVIRAAIYVLEPNSTSVVPLKEALEALERIWGRT